MSQFIYTMEQAEHRGRLLKTQYEQSCKAADSHYALVYEKVSKKTKDELERLVSSWEEFTIDKAISTPISVLIAKDLLQIK